MNRNSVSHCRERRMSLGWSPGEYGEEAELVCYSWSSGYLLIRAKPQARDKWGHFFEHKAGPMRNCGHARKRHARNFKVSEASLQLFLSNWCLWTPAIVVTIHSSVKALSTQTHSHTFLKSWRSFGSKNGGRCQAKGMTSSKNKCNKNIQKLGSQVYRSCKYMYIL